MNNREVIAQIKGMRFQVQSSLDEVEVDVDSKEAEEDNRKLVEAFDMAIKALEQTEWIPVTERLPEKTSKYLVTVGINFFGFGMNDEVSVAIYNIKDGWFCAEENKDTIIGDVTAWRPLPEPYKGDTE